MTHLIERLEQLLHENRIKKRSDRLTLDYIEMEVREYQKSIKQLSKRHIMAIPVDKEMKVSENIRCRLWEQDVLLSKRPSKCNFYGY